jgi:hypothetical protein
MCNSFISKLLSFSIDVESIQSGFVAFHPSLSASWRTPFPTQTTKGLIKFPGDAAPKADR